MLSLATKVLVHTGGFGDFLIKDVPKALRVVKYM